MNLASYQREMRDLLKRRQSAAPPECRPPGASPRLQLLQEIVLWWRLHALEQFCLLTSRLLKRSGRFDAAVLDYIAAHSISPYIEEMAILFLEVVGRSPDPLLAAVAQFELASIKTRKGDPQTYVVHWPQEPYATLADLLSLNPDPVVPPPGRYTTTIASALPHGFTVHKHSA